MNRSILFVICFALFSNIALAGRKEGELLIKDTVMGNSTNTHTEVFTKEEVAIIRVKGDKSSDIKNLGSSANEYTLTTN